MDATMELEKEDRAIRLMDVALASSTPWNKEAGKRVQQLVKELD
jgi:hypothetical protein